MNLPKRLPGPVCPFEFVARYIESTPQKDETAVAQARQHCATLRQAAKDSRGFVHDDPVVLFLIGNTAINTPHREALVSIIGSTEAIELIWRLNGWKG